MIPVLYPHNETVFTTRGYGALSDCISCFVTEVLNGEYTLVMQYMRDGLHAENLLPRNIIYCNVNGEMDAFRIYKVTRTLKDVITVYANHISYDLSGYPISPLTATSLATAVTRLTSSAGNFTISTDKTSSSDFTVNIPSSVRSWFGGKEGSLLDIYGGEWKFRMFDCQLLNRRGSDNGVRISYGVNLADYQKENEDNQYSQVWAYYTWTDEQGVFRSKFGQPASTGATDIQRTLIYDATQYFGDTIPTNTQLSDFATAYANSNHAKLVNDAQTITVTPELLDMQPVALGDTVHVIYKGELVSTRAVKTVWDVLNGRYDKIELGDVKTSIAETIKSLSETPTEPAQTLVRDVLAGTSSVVVDRIAKLGTVATLSHTDASNVLTLANSKKWSTDSVTGGQIFNYHGNLNSNSSKTYSVGNGHRGLMIIQRGSVSDGGIYFVTTSTAGAVYIAPIKSANNVTITTSTNSFTLQNTGSSNYYVSFIGSSEIS